MARTPGRVFTKAFKIDTRQHELLGLDLGEGPKRKDMRAALVIGVAWILLCIPFLGTPDEITFSIYVIPPALIVFLGVQESATQPRRTKLVEWILLVRYAVVSCRPVVWLGARQPERTEYPSLWTRVPLRKLAKLPGLGWLAQRIPEEVHTDRTGPVGRPVALQARARLIGTDYLHTLAQRRRAAQDKKKVTA